MFGKLADQYGKKPFLIIGFITFITASVLSANAETMWQLIAYRALQGLGAAPLMPIAFSMIFELVRPEKQGRVQAVFAAVNGLSLLLGPIIGAYLTEHLSWHWVFWINVPLGLAALLITVLCYKEHKKIKRGAIDYLGAALLTCTITPFMLGLVMGGRNFPWGSWPIITLFALSLCFALIFIRAERKAKEPIMALHLFNKKVVSSSGIGFLQGFVLIAVMTYIPFYIQGVIGNSVTNVGSILAHMIVAMILGTGIGGHLLHKVPVRSVFIGSVLVMSVGCGFLTQLQAHASDMYFYVSMILIGLGMGPLLPATTMLAQTSVGHEHTTSVTSLVSFFRNIGMAIGSSLCAVLVNHQILHTVEGMTTKSARLTQEQLQHLQDPNLLMDSGLHSLVPEQALIMIRDALGTGIIQVFAVTLGVALLMILFSILAGKDRLTVPSDGKKLGFH